MGGGGHEPRNVTPPSRTVNTPRRDQAGLVTLGWLLIAAAVAAAAALAAITTRNAIDSAAQQISTHSARFHAAELAAFETQAAARAQRPTPHTADRTNARWQQRCHQLRILYSDTLRTTHEHRQIRYKPGKAAPGGGWDPQTPPACYIPTRPR